MKKIIAGVDEVGRGSLIGPVYAAAVILKKKANYWHKSIVGRQLVPDIFDFSELPLFVQELLGGTWFSNSKWSSILLLPRKATFE